MSTTLKYNGLYIAQNINDRIRFPLINNDFFELTSHLIRAIMKFKVVTQIVRDCITGL